MKLLKHSTGWHQNRRCKPQIRVSQFYKREYFEATTKCQGIVKFCGLSISVASVHLPKEKHHNFSLFPKWFLKICGFPGF